MALKREASSWRGLFQFTWAARAAGLILLSGFGCSSGWQAPLEHSTIPTAGSAVSSPERGAEPDPTLTPGATRRVAISEVCSMAHEEVVWKYQRRCVKRFFRSMES